MNPSTDDYSATLADAYFDQDSRAMWEFMRLEAQNTPGYTPEQADAEFARMEEILMSGATAPGLPVMEQAATEGPVLAAFGALHLSGATAFWHCWNVPVSRWNACRCDARRCDAAFCRATLAHA